MAASCAGSCIWRARRGKWSQTSSASLNRKWHSGGAQSMSQKTERTVRQRTERRISVRLPLRVKGRDARGFAFEDDTASENLCRSGVAFRTRFDVAIGSNLEIRIPKQAYTAKRAEVDFETQGKVVHVSESLADGERVVGVQFVGPRFQRVFRSE